MRSPLIKIAVAAAQRGEYTLALATGHAPPWPAKNVDKAERSYDRHGGFPLQGRDC
jgi:hypothetical protein